MAGSNKGLIAVLAGGASLGLGVGLFYLFVWSPKQERAKAQKEIEAFSEAWAQARECLLVGAPTLSDGEAAYLALEAKGVDEAHLASCDTYLYDMKREGRYSTGDAEIEGAWRDTVPALRELAKFVGYRTAPEKPASLAKIRTELAAAIREMDRREAALRVAGDLRPIDYPGGRLPIVEGEPLKGPDGGLANASYTDVSRGRILFRVDGPDGAVTIRQATGQRDVIRSSPLAVPDTSGTWGLWLERDGEVVPLAESFASQADLMVGPLDAQGDPAGEGAPLAEHTRSVQPMPLTSFGRGADRIAVYRLDSTSAPARLVARVSADAGVTWGDPVDLPIEFRSQPLDWLLERLDFIGQEDPDGPLRWLAVHPGSPLAMRTVVPASLAPPGGEGVCFADDTTYWLLGDAFYAQGPEGPARPIPGASVEPVANSERLDCGEAGVVMASLLPSGELRTILCDASACTRWTIGSTPDASFGVAVEPGAAHLVSLASGVAFHYRLEPGAEKPFETLVGRLEGAHSIDGVARLDGTLHAVASLAEGGSALFPIDTGD